MQCDVIKNCFSNSYNVEGEKQAGISESAKAVNQRGR